MYNAEEERCYGFYTFVDQASLDKYMASDLFKLQGDPPHIKALTYKVYDVLPGTDGGKRGREEGAGGKRGHSRDSSAPTGKGAAETPLLQC